VWLGANLITASASNLAKSWGISEGFVGMTIVALGTSFPEITLAITGSIQKLAGQDTSDIVIGNAIGASMNQLILIVAIAGLIKAIKFKKHNVFFNSSFVIVAATAFYIFSRNAEISRVEGALLAGLYIVYLLYLSRQNFLEQIASKIKNKLNRKKASWTDILKLIIGLMIIVKSSQVVLEKGVALATQLGVSEATVGIVLLGFGVSLPELVIAIAAALKGSRDLSMGNLVGGTIVNICVAMALGATISGWRVDRGLVQFDIPYLLFSVIIVVLFIGSRNKLDKKESVLLLSLYLVYISLKAMSL
jgi:cation:H+ antiporter